MDSLLLGPGVAAHVRTHGGALTVHRSTRLGCCGGSAALPVAEARTPPRPEGFGRWQQDGITVYVDQGLLGETPLRIALEGFLGLKRLMVEGAAVGRGRP